MESAKAMQSFGSDGHLSDWHDNYRDHFQIFFDKL